MITLLCPEGGGESALQTTLYSESINSALHGSHKTAASHQTVSN